jgi:hypothetical protein
MATPENLVAPQGSVPIPITAIQVELRTPLILTGTYVATDVVKVVDARRAMLRLDVNAGDINNIVQLIPMVSNIEDEPIATDDVWGLLPETDGSHNAAAPTGVQQAGVDFTLDHEFAIVTIRGLVVRLPTTTAASDEYRQWVTLDVADYKWLTVLAADVGTGGTDATLGIDIAKAA